MAIPLTNLHKGRVVEQIRLVLMNLQRDMRNNAKTHRVMAVAQSPNFETLKSFVDDCAATYLRNLQWLIDLRADATRRQRLIDTLSQLGWAETDITDVAAPLRTAAIALRDAPRTSYAEIIVSCDSLIAFVDAPETLWPE